ncbi:uncharacterized protein BJX67DRAFT_364465 [Aspergillus lucknowensis]|uniref:Uncharacterized protein n=1 Tax=Aspergillus lucknowensis TaxID=176173 RepID=A0ABR4LF96_9EURO
MPPEPGRRKLNGLMAAIGGCGEYSGGLSVGPRRTNNGTSRDLFFPGSFLYEKSHAFDLVRDLELRERNMIYCC